MRIATRQSTFTKWIPGQSRSSCRSGGYAAGQLKANHLRPHARVAHCQNPIQKKGHLHKVAFFCGWNLMSVSCQLAWEQVTYRLNRCDMLPRGQPSRSGLSGQSQSSCRSSGRSRAPESPTSTPMRE